LNSRKEYLKNFIIEQESMKCTGDFGAGEGKKEFFKPTFTIILDLPGYVFFDILQTTKLR